MSGGKSIDKKILVRVLRELLICYYRLVLKKKRRWKIVVNVWMSLTRTPCGAQFQCFNHSIVFLFFVWFLFVFLLLLLCRTVSLSLCLSLSPNFTNLRSTKILQSFISIKRNFLFQNSIQMLTYIVVQTQKEKKFPYKLPILRLIFVYTKQANNPPDHQLIVEFIL